jgi:hypothetical protein
MMRTKLSQVDREAMTRAIENMRQRGGEDARQIERMLREEPREDVGEFAAYACQDRALRLKPWQTPPCWLRTDAAVRIALLEPPPDLKGRRFAAELVQQLLAAGLSRFEPDPLRSLAAAEAASKRGQSHVVTADRAER